jgi:hypothetical protein
LRRAAVLWAAVLSILPATLAPLFEGRPLASDKVWVFSV